MAWTAPETFTLGSPELESPLQTGRSFMVFENEQPAQEATISEGVWLGKCELTQEQWEAVMGTRPWAGKEYVQEHPNHPLEGR